MRIVCKDFGIDYIFSDNMICELVLDSADVFRSFLCELHHQFETAEDFLILSSNDKELVLNKSAEIVSDPFGIDLNNKKLIGRIYQDLISESKELKAEKVYEVQNMLENYIMELCDNSEYSITYDHDPDFAGILRSFNVRVDTEDFDVINRLVSYIRLVHRVLHTSLFIFVNVRDFLNDDMMELFYRSIRKEEIYIFMIERQEYKKMDWIDRMIIDSDLCLIYN